MNESLHRMLECLDQAVLQISDIPDNPTEIGGRIYTGHPGRPRIAIHEHDLEVLAHGHVTRGEVASLYNCDGRTIRRRRVEFGQAPAGPPVYDQEFQDDGTVVRTYYPGQSSELSTLSDNELDKQILEIYQQFPSFGRRLIDGYLIALGQRVPRQRILDSYARVIGPSQHVFAPRCLYRRNYNVPGPNSLWHHDGQHGQIFHSYISIADFEPRIDSL